MKKVPKVLVSQVGADVAPGWFAPAMEKVVAPLATKDELAKLATKHDVQNVVPAWFAPAMEKVAVEVKSIVAEAVAPLATKVDRLETKLDRLSVDLLFVRKAVSQLQRECLTKEAFEERMENYPTKDAFLNLMDEHARRVSHRDIQDPLFAKAMTDQSDTIAGHGKRLKRIEAMLAMSGK